MASMPAGQAAEELEPEQPELLRRSGEDGRQRSGPRKAPIARRERRPDVQAEPPV
jgi:hypothetical protein